MPEFLVKKLKEEYGSNRKAVYGTLNKIGAMHGNQETAKGEEMQAKHERDMKRSHTGKFSKRDVESSGEYGKR